MSSFQYHFSHDGTVLVLHTAWKLCPLSFFFFLRKLSIFNLFMIKFSDFLWTALLFVSLETPLIAAEVWILNAVMVPLCSVLEATPGLSGRRSSRSIYSHGSSRASLFLRVFFFSPLRGIQTAILRCWSLNRTSVALWKAPWKQRPGHALQEGGLSGLQTHFDVIFAHGSQLSK